MILDDVLGVVYAVLRDVSSVGASLPPYALTVSSAGLCAGFRLDRRPVIASSDDARLLPRFRDSAGVLLEQSRRYRAQAQALAEGLEEQPAERRPLRHELTKPGDPRSLRGLPAIARGVSGVSPGTDPWAELERKERRAA